jgi:hypothetical protein
VTQPFRVAVEAGDAGAMADALADDVVFRSPVVYKPYHGREATMQLLSFVVQVFDDFEYVDELHGEDSVCLVFRAHAGGRELQGIDHLRLDEHGKVIELTVMIRPLSGLTAVAEAMRAKLEAAGLAPEPAPSA